MPVCTNPRLIFNSIPDGLPSPGKTTVYDETETIDVETAALLGGFIVKVLAVSLDPYMRNRMRAGGVPGDMPAFVHGKVINGFGVGVVLRSESDGVNLGDHVYGFMPYQHYIIFPKMDTSSEGLTALGLKVVSNEYNLPWRYFVGILGMTGQTAYYGLKDVSNPRPGETIFISAAAGAVGHVLVQLAKSIGLKVIASVGTEEKMKLVKSLGADHVFNWKTSDIGKELKAYGPIDIYFDHVGGSTLEAAITNAAQRARFVICGAVSTYNDDIDKAYGVRNLWLLNRYRIRMEGFIVIDWHDKYETEFFRIMPQKIASGELRYVEHVYKGLEKAGEGIRDLMTGANLGKAVVVIADE